MSLVSASIIEGFVDQAPAKMTRLRAQVALICLCSLLVPPAFMHMGAYELGFISSALIAAYLIGVVCEAWMDFGRPGSWLLLSSSVVLFWPSYLLIPVSACWVGIGCR